MNLANITQGGQEAVVAAIQAEIDALGGTAAHVTVEQNTSHLIFFLTALQEALLLVKQYV